MFNVNVRLIENHESREAHSSAMDVLVMVSAFSLTFIFISTLDEEKGA